MSATQSGLGPPAQQGRYLRWAVYAQSKLANLLYPVLDNAPESGRGDISTILGSCPISLQDSTEVLLGHGSGGKLPADLVEKLFLPAFRNPYLDKLDDQNSIVIARVTRIKVTRA